jgi:hypothetical protein
VAPGAAVDGEIPIWLNRAFLDKVNIERIVPEPVEMKTAPDRVFYHFSVANPDQPAEITFHLEPAEPGLAQGQLGIVDAETISFDQFIFP